MHRLVLISLLGLGSGGCTAMETHAETANQLAEDGFYLSLIWLIYARYRTIASYLWICSVGGAIG